MYNFKFMDSWPAWVRWLSVFPATMVSVAFLFASNAIADSVLPQAILAGGEPVALLTMNVWPVVLFSTSALFVWLGAATAPHFKLVSALVIAVAPIAFAYRGHTSMSVRSTEACIVGVMVAWILIAWGYLRRRQAGFLTR